MVSEQERKLLDQRMAEAGISSLRAYMLKMALNGHVLRLDLSSVREMVSLLRNATNNINQIARRVNTTGNIYSADIEDLREKYDQIWNQASEILRKLAEL